MLRLFAHPYSTSSRRNWKKTAGWRWTCFGVRVPRTLDYPIQICAKVHHMITMHACPRHRRTNIIALAQWFVLIMMTDRPTNQAKQLKIPKVTDSFWKASELFSMFKHIVTTGCSVLYSDYKIVFQSKVYLATLTLICTLDLDILKT